MMVRVKKEPKPERFQTHVYLTLEDLSKLKRIADRESRSVTGQIEFFLRQAISGYHPDAK